MADATALSDASLKIQESLRVKLTQSATRVMDLFKEWDADKSGSITKKEFRKALPTLSIECTKAQADELFDSFDPDGSGTIEFNELNKMLRRSDLNIDPSLQPGAVAVQTSRAGKHKLRRNVADRSAFFAYFGRVLSRYFPLTILG